MTVMRRTGTSSSSATICVSAVDRPVPRSTFPEYTMTPPSRSIAKKESTSSGATVFFNCGAPSPGVNIAKYTTMAPVFSNSRRFGLLRLVMAAPAGSGAGGTLYCTQDARMRTASTEVRGQAISDLCIRRVRSLGQQRCRLHDHSVDAIAALHRLFLDESLLKRMGIFGRTQPLQ